MTNNRKIQEKKALLEVLISLSEKLDYIERDADSDLFGYTHDGDGNEIELDQSDYKYEWLLQAQDRKKACESARAYLEKLI